MTTEVQASDIDVFLNTIASANPLKLCVCQTKPLTLSDCVNVSGSGGKRITIETTITGEVTISDGANAISRKLTIPSKVKTNGALAEIDGGSADLWLAAYDDTTLRLVTDEITNEAVVNGATITTPPFEYGVNQ